MRNRNSIFFLVYRYRFLAIYTLFGFLSLIVELLIIRTLVSFNLQYYLAAFIGFPVGLLVAFFLNIRFNFKIAPPKRKKALLYFTLISGISFLIQLLLRQDLIRRGMSVDLSRFVIAGSFFLVSYVLHRRFSFREYKKVGVAIYADGVEDIKSIYSRISNVCDFIHIDIVDRTFRSDCKEVKAYRAEVVRAYWQNKPIEVHIMSRKPSEWLPDLLPHVDTIYLHKEIDEDLDAVLETIRIANCNPGIVMGIKDSVSEFEPVLEKVKHVLVLAIPNPGHSGQTFSMETLSLLKDLDHYRGRSKITICVDGGVNKDTIKYLNVEAVVSGSFVLNSENPVRSIMVLQTSGEYEKY